MNSVISIVTSMTWLAYTPKLLEFPEVPDLFPFDKYELGVPTVMQ